MPTGEGEGEGGAVPATTTPAGTQTHAQDKVPLTAEVLFAGEFALSAMGVGSQFHFKGDVKNALVSATAALEVEHIAAIDLAAATLQPRRHRSQPRSGRSAASARGGVAAALTFSSKLDAATLDVIVGDVNDAISAGTFETIQVRIIADGQSQTATATASAMRATHAGATGNDIPEPATTPRASSEDSSSGAASADPAESTSSDDSSTSVVAVAAVVGVLVVLVAVVAATLAYRRRRALQAEAPNTTLTNTFENPSYDTPSRPTPNTIQLSEAAGGAQSDC